MGPRDYEETDAYETDREDDWGDDEYPPVEQDREYDDYEDDYLCRGCY